MALALDLTLIVVWFILTNFFYLGTRKRILINKSISFKINWYSCGIIKINDR